MMQFLTNKSFFLLAGIVMLVSSLSLAAPVLAARPGFVEAPAVNSGTGMGASFNWSGYEATGGTPALPGSAAQSLGGYTAVGGTWIIPSVAPSSSLSADATWVGVGGVTSHDLIQVGTQAVTGNGGDQVQYQAWIETLPQATQQIPVTIHAGDSVTASVTQVSSGEWQFSFRDNTTGASYSTQVAYQSSLSSAEWIEEAPTDQDGILPLDQFGTISFTNAYATANGGEVSLAGANAEPLSMMNTANQALAVPSALGGDGASFTVSRTSATAGTIGSSSGFSSRGRGHRIGVGIQGFSPRPAAPSGATSSFGASFGNSGGSRSFGTSSFRGRFNFIRLPQQEEQLFLQMIRQEFNRGL